MRWLPLLVAGCVSNGNGLARRATDVSGHYALAYDDHVRFTLGTRHADGSERDLINFGNDANGQPMIFNAATFCAQHVCPLEALSPSLTIAQSGDTLDVMGHPGSVMGASNFVIQLGESADCGALPTSRATGRFTHRGETPYDGGADWPGDAPVDGITNGLIDQTFDCVPIEMSLGFAGTKL